MSNRRICRIARTQFVSLPTARMLILSYSFRSGLEKPDALIATAGISCFRAMKSGSTQTPQHEQHRLQRAVIAIVAASEHPEKTDPDGTDPAGLRWEGCGRLDDRIARLARCPAHQTGVGQSGWPLH